ncbi:MAG: HEAT repeat domain-containing protein, partial [Planctomycetota bacterium]
MRRLCWVLGAALAACKGPPDKTTEVQPISLGLPEALQKRPSVQLVRRTNRNIAIWQELMIQGRPDQARSLALAIGKTVDENFEVFVRVARTGEMTTLRNQAIKCVSYSREHRDEARRLLEEFLGDPTSALAANAARGLGLLKDPRTDLAPLIALLARGDRNVRTNAAHALKELFLVKPTPEVLTPQYRVALDRLAAMASERTNTRGRRAAVWALANLRHPEALDHLIDAL